MGNESKRHLVLGVVMLGVLFIGLVFSLIIDRYWVEGGVIINYFVLSRELIEGCLLVAVGANWVIIAKCLSQNGNQKKHFNRGREIK